jgi:hypothetical protein
MADLHRSDTELEMVRRHLREGEERLARQETIVAELEIEGHTEQAALGKRLLENIRRALELRKRHLRDIEAQSRR